MKGIIFYYSSIGNTELACRYIANKVIGVKWDLVSIIKYPGCKIEDYDIVGFAAFADYWSPSPIFKTFINGLPVQQSKPAFVFNTFGGFNGRTLKIMATLVEKKGFRVLAGHALHTPESIPTMIMMGLANTQAPDNKELGSLDRFVNDLNGIVKSLEGGVSALSMKKISFPIVNYLIPALPRSMSKSQMGNKMVDLSLCTKCKKCVSICPYSAIQFEERPVFTEGKCRYCWRCYNLCPEKAIYTKKYKGAGHYPAPDKGLAQKLDTNSSQ